MKHFISLLFLFMFSYSALISSEEISCNHLETLNKCQQKILNYVHIHKSNFRVEDLILLDYLQRRFSLPNEYSFKNSFIRVPTQRDKQSLEVYGKLVNYTLIPWKKPLTAEPFIWLELQALFIERQKDCPTRDELLSKLKRQLYEGGYSTTHTALALGWFIEQYCLSNTDPIVIEFKDEVIRELFRLSQTISYPTDLKMESLAFICYLGGKKEIDIDDIIELLAYQRDDGTFSGTRNPNDGMNIHTTLLVLWLTCEFLNYKDTRQEPMIVYTKNMNAY